MYLPVVFEIYLKKKCPEYKVPHKDKLHRILIKYSRQMVNKGLSQLSNKICGLAVDGATLLSHYAYAFILVHYSGLRLAGISKVNNQNATTLAK